jgi:hypothetical protein
MESQAIMTQEEDKKPIIGVLALQGAFVEHQQCLESIGCRTIQVRTILCC